PLDELLDERAPVSRRHLLDLLAERLGRLHARRPRHPDAGVAAGVLDDEGEAEGVEGALEVLGRAHLHALRRGDAPRVAHPLHRLARRLVEGGRGAGERDVEPLQRQDDLDAGGGVVPRPVAEVEEEVVALADELGEPVDRRVLVEVDRRAVVPLEVGRGVGGDVVVGEGVVGVLRVVGEDAGAHAARARARGRGGGTRTRASEAAASLQRTRDNSNVTVQLWTPRAGRRVGVPYPLRFRCPPLPRLPSPTNRASGCSPWTSTTRWPAPASSAPRTAWSSSRAASSPCHPLDTATRAA